MSDATHFEKAVLRHVSQNELWEDYPDFRSHKSPDGASIHTSTFLSMKDKGLIEMRNGDDGTIITLTPKGNAIVKGINNDA